MCALKSGCSIVIFFIQAADGIRDYDVTGVQTCALPIWNHGGASTSLLHTEPAELGEWVHVALTYDSETKELNFYVNGDVSATANSESTPFLLVNIGRRVPTQNFWLTGVVDNIRIYDVVLPVEDIVAQPKRPPKILEILSLSLAGEDQL